MGNDYRRDYDSDTGEFGYSREYDRGDRVEKEFVGDHGGHYLEEVYRDGTTYRIYDDGTVEKYRVYDGGMAEKHS